MSETVTQGNLFIQNRLRSGEPVEKLVEFYGIRYVRHPKYPNLIQFQHAPGTAQTGKHWTLVRQSKGLILDEADNWNVIARPIDRFFRFGDPDINIDRLNWKKAHVSEYLDGEMCYLYWYDKRWHVATTTSPDGSAPVGFQSITWSELFWQTWEEMKFHAPSPSQGHITFSFILMTPYYRRVVKYNHNHLRLVSWRFRQMGHEIPTIDTFQYWPVKEFAYADIDDIKLSFTTTNPLLLAGYVVCDDLFRRAMILHPGYERLRAGVDNTPFRHVVDTITGKQKHTLFDGWHDVYSHVIKAYDNIAGEIEAVYKAHKDLAMKDFALALNHTPYADVLFSVKSGKADSVEDALRGTSKELMLDLLKLGGL